MARPVLWCSPKKTMSSGVITAICTTILSACIEVRISWRKPIPLRDSPPARIAIYESLYPWRRHKKRYLSASWSRAGRGMRLSSTLTWWTWKPKSGECKLDASGSKTTFKLSPSSPTAQASPSTTDSKKSSSPCPNNPLSSTEKMNHSYSCNIW